MDPQRQTSPPPASLSAEGELCEQCGFRPKHRDEKGLRKWCERCIEIYQEQVAKIAKSKQVRITRLVGELYAAAKIEDLDPDVQAALSKLDVGEDVFIFGPVGTGKTYAMAALLRRYVLAGDECARINYDDFCVKVRSTMSPAAKETEWGLIEPMRNVDKLFIDDLGLRSKQETDFAYVTLYSILNKRQERRLPTFISSNKSIKQLGQSFDARVASRLRTACVIEMKGEDRRLKQTSGVGDTRS